MKVTKYSNWTDDEVIRLADKDDATDIEIELRERLVKALYGEADEDSDES